MNLAHTIMIGGRSTDDDVKLNGGFEHPDDRIIVQVYFPQRRDIDEIRVT